MITTFFTIQVPSLCVLVSSVMRLLVYAGTCDTKDLNMVCRALKSTHEGGEMRHRKQPELLPCVCLNLVTYHLIFAITGLVFCGLNSVINIVFYNFQSKVKHNECNTVSLKTIFQMMLGSWLTWTILCAAGHFVVSFEQVDKSNQIKGCCFI